jgi:hypothetical protein
MSDAPWVHHIRSKDDLELYHDGGTTDITTDKTRKDLAVEHCRRLIIDSPLGEACIFDKYYTSAGDYLERYIQVREIVITEKSLSSVKSPETRSQRERWDWMIRHLLSFNKYVTEDRCSVKRIIWHTPISPSIDIICRRPWVQEPSIVLDYHHCDFVRVGVGAFRIDPIIRYGSWRCHRDATQRYDNPYEQQGTELPGARIAKWLLGVWRYRTLPSGSQP